MFGLPPLPRTLAAALRDFRDARRDIRFSALRDLVRHARGDGRAEVISELTRALAGEQDLELRAEVALALADADAREALETLVDAASSSDPRVRQMTLLALGEVAPHDDEKVLKVLRAAFRAPEPALRFQALVAIHHVGPGARDPLIVEAMADEDAEIRAMAFRIAEERWHGPDAPAHVLDRARRALGDSSLKVRLCAAILLGAHADAAGGSVLLDAINAPNKIVDLGDRQAAIELVSELGVPGVENALLRRAFGTFGARNDSLGFHARIALAKLGNARARQAIARGLRAWSRDDRTLAVVAAGRARLAETRPAIEAMRGDPARADPDAIAEALAELAKV